MREFVNRIMNRKEEDDARVTEHLLCEATVDFPRVGLDPVLWDRKEDGSYILLPEVKELIYEYIRAYPGTVDLEPLIEELHLVGSMATNLYTDDADIDVHIVPKFGLLPAEKEHQEEIQTAVKDWSHNNPVYVGQHPVEIYLQLLPEQEMIGDAVYDIQKDVWKKGPRIEHLDYNPYEVFGSVLDQVRAFAQKADVDLGELKRDIIDFEVVRAAMQRLPLDYKTQLKEELQNKLEEIEDSVDELLKDKKEWVELRRGASRPTSQEKALGDIEVAKKWHDANAIFKLLNRYKYIRIITELEKLMEDDKIDANEVGVIRSILGYGSGQ